MFAFFYIYILILNSNMINDVNENRSMSSSNHQVRRIVADNLLFPGKNLNNYRSGVLFLSFFSSLRTTNKKAAGTAGDHLFDLTFILFTT